VTNLLIVESPTKAKKIAPFLGAGWTVKASVGHIRDLPKKTLAVSRPGYEIEYEVIEGKHDVVAGLRTAAKAADAVYLATDPDREGEAISWHLEQLLHLRNPRRVEFHEITKSAIQAAIASPRAIDYALVHAQEARRALDRLVGYEVSSALRRKTGRPLTAGRVQTVGLRLIVDREEEIAAFGARDHYGVTLTFAGGVGDKPWTAEWLAKPLLPEGEKLWTDAAFAERVAALRDVRVAAAEEKITKSSPPAPYTTSTLQQAGSNRLRFKTKQTMQLAQGLFEKGFITYHRTDSPNLSDEACDSIREYGRANGLAVLDVKRTWAAKDSAQGAHEAIRPTHIDLVDARLEGATEEEQRLYELIWQRAVASQMPDALFDVRVVTLQSSESLDGKTIAFVARGKTIREPGYKALVADDATTDAKDDPASSNPVPPLADGELRRATDGKLLKKKTAPPDRYTEATLVKALEDRGVGRPSTYSSIVETIQARAYVEIKDRKFYPTEIGATLIRALRSRFAFAEVAYTSDMELQLDQIAAGREQYVDVVRAADDQLQRELVAFADVTVEGAQIETAGVCPTCSQGELVKRVRKPRDGETKPGSFWSCSRYPNCTAAFNDVGGKPDLTPREPRVEGGVCPSCKKNQLLRHKNTRGYWWGCAGYRADKCEGTYTDREGKPDFDAERTPVADGPQCPKCSKGKLRRLVGVKGAFWGCSRFRDGCKATFPDVDGAPDLTAAKKARRAS